MNINNSDKKIERKRYSPQFKDQALERAVKDGIPQVAKKAPLIGGEPKKSYCQAM